MSLRARLFGSVCLTSLVMGSLALGSLVLGGVGPASAGVLFSDGFESGTTAAWTTVRGLVVESTDAFSGVSAAEAATTGTAAYARKKLTAPTTSVDYSLQFKVVSRGTTAVNVMAVRPSTGAPVAAVFLNAKGKLALKVGGASTVSSTVVDADSWHSLTLHVEVAGASSTTQVWLDGAANPTLTSAAQLSTAVTQVEIGDPLAKRTFDVRFDDVSVQDTQPADTTAPTAPANLGAVPISDHRVDLGWDPATDDTGVTDYDVFRDGNQIDSVRTGTTYTDLTTKPETAYTYKVQARDAAGNTSALSDPANVTTPPATSGGSVHIAAAGDIACPSTGVVSATTCQQMATSDLLTGGSYDRVLALGDNQYNSGTLNEFLGSYDPSWGRVKSITAPVLGNHEYQTAGAAGYFDYFGGAAHDPQRGYYSYDVGSWHLIALNSNCGKLGPTDGCAAGTPQDQWLKADLAAHPNICTLAYWHHPLASSGNHGGIIAVNPFWDALYAAGADVVLNGHSHNYERFVPMNPSKIADPDNGIREFVVGTGGEDHSGGLATAPATSQVRNFDTFGVLDLTLNDSSYDWNFIPTAGGTFTDSGTTSCH